MHKRLGGAHGDALICASSPLTSMRGRGASNRVALEDYASAPRSPVAINLTLRRRFRAQEVIKAAQGGDARAIELSAAQATRSASRRPVDQHSIRRPS